LADSFAAHLAKETNSPNLAEKEDGPTDTQDR